MLVSALVLIGSLGTTATAVPHSVAQTAAPACDTSGPESGAFEVRVCLSAVDGEAGGDVALTATVEATTGALPPVELLIFSLAKLPSTGERDILTDYAEPYTFILPTYRYVDGSYRIEVETRFDGGFETEATSITLTFENGISRAPAPEDTWEPTSGRPGSPFVLAAVGDGAGGLPGADAVGDLITGWDPNMLLYLGDVYNSGTYVEFYNYYEPTLGNLKEITNPVPGNHEAGGAGFQGYFEYWDTHTHYYSTGAAGWRLIGIDNTEVYRQTERGDPQFDWLEQELAASPDDCTIVFMHYPRFGLGRTADYRFMQQVWQLLAEHDVEIVLSGHEHNYQRWQPMDGSGGIDPEGVTQLVVGTGGHDLESFRTSDARVVSAVEGRDGALRLVLTNGGAEFQFVATDGSVLDSGSIPCSVQGALTLSKTKSKPDGRVEATLARFTPDSDVTLRWEDGAELGTARTDGDGNAVITFRTPSLPYGSYVVTAEDASGLTGAAQLAVIPSIQTTSETVAAGESLDVSLSGFAAGKEVEIRLVSTDRLTFEVIGSATTGPDGSATATVAIPAATQPGEHLLVAQPATGERRSASDRIAVIAPGGTPATGD
jgi:hypothetical protein